MTDPLMATVAIHRDGIPWYEAPVPPRRHKCTWQTSGSVGFDRIVRCACGAYYDFISKKWFDRNQTRNETDRVQPETKRRWWRR